MAVADAWDRCAVCQGPLLTLACGEVQARFWEVTRAGARVRMCEACYHPADHGVYVAQVRAAHHGRGSAWRNP